MVGLLPLPALGPGPTPPPASVFTESLPAPGLKGQGTGHFALKLQGRSLAPPLTLEGSWEGQEESGFRIVTMPFIHLLYLLPSHFKWFHHHRSHSWVISLISPFKKEKMKAQRG